MAAEILPVASTAANSADVVVAAGTPLTVALKGATNASALVLVLLKDNDGAYQKIDQLDSGSRQAIVIDGPGTYRFTRVAGSACGVFSG